MLILSRKLGESIVIDGRITVKIVRLEGEIVKLGIDAPIEVPVHRQEVYDEIQRNNQEALAGEAANVPTLSGKSSAPSTRPQLQQGKAPMPRTRG
jgi:carbon storage regulator